MKIKPRKIAEVRTEVHRLIDGKGLKIDPSIKDLVIGLRRWGVRTDASCEGHENWGEPLPWVDFPLTDAGRVGKLLTYWFATRQNKPDWVFVPYGSGRWLRMEPYNKKDLKTMQKDARALGRFLQKIRKL